MKCNKFLFSALIIIILVSLSGSSFSFAGSVGASNSISTYISDDIKVQTATQTNAEKSVIDLTNTVSWEEGNVPEISTIDWKKMSDEDLTDVINHSSYEEVGRFLSKLSEDEFEEIISRETTLKYPIYTFEDTSEYTLDSQGNKIPVQKKGMLAEFYYEYALSTLINTYAWEDTSGTYKGTADGYFYFKIEQDGKTTTNLTVKVYNVTAGQGNLTNYSITGTTGTWETTSVNSEKQDWNWAGIVLNGQYVKPAHYYTLWSSSGHGLGRYDPWNNDYTNYTLDYTHTEKDVKDTVRIQVNGCNAGMVKGYENYHATGKISLVKYNNALKIDPNGGNHNGETQVYQLSNKVCEETTVVNEPTRIGYEFDGWTITNDSGAKGSIKGNVYTHCNSEAKFSTTTDVYSNKTVYTTLTAKWKKVSNKIIYELNGGKNHPDNPDSYIHGKGVDKFYTPSKVGNEFKGWYEDPEFTKPISSIDKNRKGDVYLYAKWSQLIQIIYDGNGADNGVIQNEVISEVDCEKSYKIQKNEGYTNFSKNNAAFTGWDSDKDSSSQTTDYKVNNLPTTISFNELKKFINKDVTTDINGVKNVPVIILYAIWDEIPEITVTSNSNPGPEEPGTADILEFYEGEYVTKDMLLQNIKAYDLEDGNITDDIRITKIEYEKGKLVAGEEQPSYEIKWNKDMPEDEVLDTWFLQMKKDAVVTHNITYEVTDSYGNTNELVWKIKVKYNEFPQITGENRYFTLAEAQEGKITFDRLMEYGRSWDKEDCSPHCPIHGSDKNNCLDEEIPCEFTKEKLTLIGFDDEKFKNFKESGYEILSYYVIDRYGKETVMKFAVYIIDDSKDVEGSKVIRFVDEDNYNKNIGYKIEDLTENELAVRNKNGGLNVGSVWYTNDEYRYLLQSVFDNEPTLKQQWYFSQKDVSDTKTFISKNGIGNSKLDNALSDFIIKFQSNKAK